MADFMTDTTKPAPRFTSMAEMVDDQLVLKPLLESYLVEAKFPDIFSITFHKAGKAREPDDFFHPSTHPLWPDRLLWFYLTRPQDMVEEMLSYESRMAVTMGTAVHGFMEMCIKDAGIMVPLAKGEICPACRKVIGEKRGQCSEFGAIDLATGSRGHMDGNVKILTDGRHWKSGVGGFEFKTANPMSARTIINSDNDIEAFIKKWPEYYAQVQEYMRISGLTQFIVIVAVLGFPWKLIEFQIPYEPIFALKTEHKYLSVRDHQQRMLMPDPCCAPKTATAQQCPARYVCPIGMLR